MTTSLISLPRKFELGDDPYPHVRRVLQRALMPANGTLEPRTRVSLQEDPGMVEGAFLVRAARHPDGAALDIRGGGLPGLIYGAQEVVKSLTHDDAVPVQVSGSPALQYRVVWTWDHSTNWDVVALGGQDTGAFNPYLRQPEIFESDYFRLIDFLSDNRVAGVVVYGLFRDGHGGEESAKRVARYAKERGVRLLPGIAINAYGGFYFEGEHPFNLATWLRKHPERALEPASMTGFSIDDYGYVPFPRADYSVAANPHLPENHQWHLEGIDWILDTLDVGGLFIEFGDYAGNDLLGDMKRLLPGVLERARAKLPDGWLMSELGWDHMVEPGRRELLSGLPGDCVYEYTYNKSYWPRLVDSLTPGLVDALPTSANVLRAQAGTQWNQQRHSMVAKHYLDAASVALRNGLDGYSIFTEASDYHPTNELSYLAYARGAYEGQLDWTRFLVEELAPRLGGGEAAREFVALSEGLEEHKEDLGWLRSAGERARVAGRGLDGEQYRRWLWLEEQLSRHAFNAERMPQELSTRRNR